MQYGPHETLVEYDNQMPGRFAEASLYMEAASGTLWLLQEALGIEINGNEVTIAPKISGEFTTRNLNITSQGLTAVINYARDSQGFEHIDILSNEGLVINSPQVNTTPTPTSIYSSTPTPTPTETSIYTSTPTNTPLPPTPTNTALPPTPTQTPTVGAGAEIFSDGFESGDFSAWSSSSTDGGDLSVNTSAALLGSFGMHALIDDNSNIFVHRELLLRSKQYLHG